MTGKTTNGGKGRPAEAGKAGGRKAAKAPGKRVAAPPRARKDPVVRFWEEHEGELGKDYKLDY
jgi:hypothetical protein